MLAQQKEGEVRKASVLLLMSLTSLSWTSRIWTVHIPESTLLLCQGTCSLIACLERREEYLPHPAAHHLYWCSDKE